MPCEFAAASESEPVVWLVAEALASAEAALVWPVAHGFQAARALARCFFFFALTRKVQTRSVKRRGNPNRPNGDAAHCFPRVAIKSRTRTCARSCASLLLLYSLFTRAGWLAVDEHGALHQPDGSEDGAGGGQGLERRRPGRAPLAAGRLRAGEQVFANGF